MPGMDPRVVLIMVGIALVVWLGGKVKHGIEKVGHGIVHVLKALPHPSVEYKAK